MYCPPLTEEFTESSERLDFPVLLVEYPMPFVAISRAVAAANLLEQSHRLVRTERIYHAMQRTVTESHESSALTGVLSKQLGCEMHVCHGDPVEPWYPEDPKLNDDLVAVLSTMAARSSSQLRAGAFAEPLPDGRDVRLVDIPTQPNAVLVLVSDGKKMPDAILVQHAATVIALELSQSLMDVENRRRNGAEFLAQLIEGRIDTRRAKRQLRDLRIDPGHATMLAVTSDQAAKLSDIHVALWRNRLPHLVMHRSGLLYLLSAEEKPLDEVVRAHLGPEACLGVSGVIKTIERIPEAARESGWAVRAAARTGSRMFRYGQATTLFGISGIDEAAALVDRVLGTLIEEERQQDKALISTLEAFFAHQRSWQKTADALHVHRQTVLHRIRRVEDITGLDVNETSDIAELWLALQARALLRNA
jgi:purine catabolism regulator